MNVICSVFLNLRQRLGNLAKIHMWTSAVLKVSPQKKTFPGEQQFFVIENKNYPKKSRRWCHSSSQ